MSDTSGSRWPWPRDRWERAILLGTAVAVLVALSAAIGTVRARARVHKAAILSLQNYAAVGMEQFVNGYEALIRESFIPILPPSDDVEPASRRDPLPAAEMLAVMTRLQRDPCKCLIAPGPTAVFRLGLGTSESEVVDSLGRPVAALDPLVAAAVRSQADSLSRVAWRYGFMVTPSAEGPQFAFFSHRADAATGRRYAYGFTLSAARMAERVFRPAFQSVRLIPRHLLAAVPGNGAFLSLELMTREGKVLFSTLPAYPDGPTNALILPTLRGALLVRAHLNPAVKDALLPGGIPPLIPVREVALIALSLALLLAIAALGLRVGDLARLRSDLASSVTHELRTPLTQIRLAAETVLLGRAKDAEAERRSLGSIVDETKRLQQLIDNVLHFSRAERQLTRVRAEPVELGPVVERAAAGPGADGRPPGDRAGGGRAGGSNGVGGRKRAPADRAQPAGQRGPVRPRPADHRYRRGAARRPRRDAGRGRRTGYSAGGSRAGVEGVRAAGTGSRFGGDRQRTRSRRRAGAGRGATGDVLDRRGGGAGGPDRGASAGGGSGAGVTRVLVVEDHHSIAQGLQENLEVEGFEVRVASDGLDAIRVATSWLPDLVLLDLMLPKRSGFDVLAAIRASGATMPVMVLSARGSEGEKVRALKAGADDYVVKPFGLLEVLARVQALLRRSSGERPGAGTPERYDLGAVVVDVPTRSVHRGDEPVVLRPREFDLLVALCRARGAVVSRGDLLNRVWGYDPYGGHPDGGHPHRGPAPAARGRRRESRAGADGVEGRLSSQRSRSARRPMNPHPPPSSLSASSRSLRPFLSGR